MTLVTSEELKEQIDQIETQIEALEAEYDATFQKWREELYGDPAEPSTYAHMRKVQEEKAQLRDKRWELQDKYWDAREYERENRFVRPNGNRFYEFINKGVGAPPKIHLKIHDVSKKLEEITLNKWLPIGMIAAAMIIVSTIVYLLPVLALNPILFTATILLPSELEEGAVATGKLLIIAIVVGIYLLMKRKRKAGSFLDNAALEEEQWFRQGAEEWSWHKRVTSCLSFGAAHLTMLIYPFAVNIVQVVLGGVFLWVYLREYRLSGDGERATLVVTKLHATYNRYVFNMASVAILALTVWLAFSIVVQFI